MKEKFKSFVRNKDIFLPIVGALYLIILVLIAITINPKIDYGNGVIHYSDSFFGLPVQWYAIFILSGIVIGGIFAYYEFKRAKWDTEILMDALLIFVPLSIVSARLYYVFFDWIGEGNSYTFMEIVDIRAGGLAIHGVILIVFIGLILFARRKKVSYWGFLDMVVVGLFLGQIMGRWGNFMNHEAYGPVIKSQWVLKILPNFIVNQMTNPKNPLEVFHPTFLYEGIWNIIGLTIVLSTRRKKIAKVGDYAGFYLIWYGIGRGALIEPFREDALKFFGAKINVWLSLTLLLIGGVLIIVLRRVFDKEQMYYADLTGYDINKEEKKVEK